MSSVLISTTLEASIPSLWKAEVSFLPNNSFVPTRVSDAAFREPSARAA